MPRGPERLRSLRGGRVIELHKAVGGHLRNEHLRDQRKALVEGRVNAGDDEQKHEKQHEVDAPGEDRLRPDKNGRGDAEAHDDAGGVHEQSGHQLAMDHRRFVLVDLPVKPRKIALLLIGGADLADVLQRLLHSVRYIQRRRLCRFGIAPLHSAAAEQQRKRHGHAPKAGEGKPPVVGEQHHRDDRRRDKGAVEITQTVRPDVLQAVHVAHDGLGQIGEVTLAEPAQRQLPQTLRNADAHVPHLGIDKAVSRPVLLQVRQKRQQEKHKKQRKERDRPRQRRAVCERVHEARHQKIQDTDAEHDHKVGHDRPKRSQLHVLHALIGERILTLKVFPEHHIASPSVVIFHCTARL